MLPSTITPITALTVRLTASFNGASCGGQTRDGRRSSPTADYTLRVPSDTRFFWIGRCDAHSRMTVMARDGLLEHLLAGCPGVVAADALQFPTKAGSVEGIQHNLDCGRSRWRRRMAGRNAR